MHRRLVLFLLAAITVIAAIAPAASAHRGGGGRAVCGTVDASSALPGTLVLSTRPGVMVTIANPDAVALDGVAVGSKACARVKVVRADDGTRSLALVSIKVKPAPPYAVVTAAGKVTIGDGSVTVATLTFALPEGRTLPARLKNGRFVVVRGTIAAEGGALTLTHLKGRRVSFGHGHGRAALRHGRHVGRWAARAMVRGPITAYTAPTADAAGSVAIAGIALAVPAGRTMPAATAVGAKAVALARVVADVLTLKRIGVRAAAPATT